MPAGSSPRLPGFDPEYRKFSFLEMNMSPTEYVSIFNDVLGPVMRGPSSSHTAGSYHIGRVARSLLGEAPASAVFTFDPDGSYAATYSQQSADKAFTAGLMEWPLTDDRFARALDVAAEKGPAVSFRTAVLESADHPNAVRIELLGVSGRALRLMAKSTGGGGFLVNQLETWAVAIDGKFFEIYAVLDKANPAAIEAILDFVPGEKKLSDNSASEDVLLTLRSPDPPAAGFLRDFAGRPGVKMIWAAAPVYFPKRAEPLFDSGAGMVRYARECDLTLGQAALRCEAQLLGMTEAEAMDEMLRRADIMAASVSAGLESQNVHMRLLEPSAGAILDAERKGALAAGGLHARAGARALAAMHVSNSGGIVLAAPTGGSAGVLPGVAVTLVLDSGLSRTRLGLALFAAGAVGFVVARRATFAAEVAGCQVEIGAAGAMAAAAVVEAAGGTARQAADAAAIAFQNTMGSVCDLVQGLCEIPCHTRNAVAASNAFLCADLILGGYRNPIPLDETVDAVFASGKMLPPELLCTSLGGLAVTPSALAMKPKI
jgi:L-serine dehydratase